ncbi:unnamed protein product [Cuscuta epithymum]|uniref:Uncharacterized protein n=1 Tax=Cuscuta epithymum TaxID=186058 RepID=A0AAV0FYM4_9ASTE|nr:unnamed protein product [Cuscuta epithymum]
MSPAAMVSSWILIQNSIEVKQTVSKIVHMDTGVKKHHTKRSRSFGSRVCKLDISLNDLFYLLVQNVGLIPLNLQRTSNIIIHAPIKMNHTTLQKVTIGESKVNTVRLKFISFCIDFNII